jgi:hypothetical protein
VSIVCTNIWWWSCCAACALCKICYIWSTIPLQVFMSSFLCSGVYMSYAI